MTPKPHALRAWVDEQADADDEGLLLADGLDDAILGVCHRYTERFVVYDLSKVLRLLEAQGMSPEEAEEFFSFNTLGAWVGDMTPGFIVLAPGRSVWRGRSD